LTTNNQAKTLDFHNEKHLPLHRLPFVGKGGPEKIRLSFWSVPSAGGYIGGNKTGKALALIYLQHLKENDSDSGGILQHMAFDMLEGCDDDEARRGQVVGFFAELERWLSGAAKHLEGGLNSVSQKQLLQAANDGLAFDEESFINSLPDDE